MKNVEKTNALRTESRCVNYLYPSNLRSIYLWKNRSDWNGQIVTM